MSLKNRKSVLALVEQIDSKPIAPTNSNQYLALQQGFSFSPEFAELENAELKNSIGRAKTIMGVESPTFSNSHYLRASGVEGQAPNFGLLLKSLLGSQIVNAVEYDTVAGTTDSSIQLGLGEAANFVKGQALLVKDTVNGYSIRNVLELDLALDTIELSQPVANAITDGTLLGKAITYQAESEGHPSLSIWGYRANGGAVELISDAKVSELGVEIAAGELINGSYTLAGIEYFFNPIEIVAGQTFVDIEIEGAVTISVSLKEGFYKDPHDLAESLTQLLQAGGASDLVVTYDDEGKFVFSKDAGSLDLLLDTGVNAANSAWNALGFIDLSADLTGALEYTSEVELEYEAPQSPQFDDAEPLVAKHNEVIIGDKDVSACFGARSLNLTVTNEVARQPNLCAPTGFKGQENTSRLVTIAVMATLQKHEAKFFRKFRKNENVQFTFNAGQRAGGQWKAGSCVNVFSPSMTISQWSLTDEDDIVVLEMQLTAYVKKNDKEFFINFL